MKNDKIVVIMGGTSTEAEVSRRSGQAILTALQSKGFNAHGMELVPESFAQDIKNSGAKFVFNALHGKYGEDGMLQGTLDMMGIPYTGSGLLAAAITMDKAATKKLLLGEGISTPRSMIYRRGRSTAEMAEEIIHGFDLPVVIKAASQGSSIGVYIVEADDELEKALQDAFSYDEEVVVEEFIFGRELTVAVWGDGKQQEAFPVIEITTVTGRYDYETKYKKGASTHIIPAPISPEKTNEVKELALRTYNACGCKGVARVDFMFSQDETPYVIEVNSVPGMTETSLVPDAARAAGIEFPELCARMLEMAGY